MSRSDEDLNGYNTGSTLAIAAYFLTPLIFLFSFCLLVSDFSRCLHYLALFCPFVHYAPHSRYFFLVNFILFRFFFFKKKNCYNFNYFGNAVEIIKCIFVISAVLGIRVSALLWTVL